MIILSGQHNFVLELFKVFNKILVSTVYHAFQKSIIITTKNVVKTTSNMRYRNTKRFIYTTFNG